MALIRRPSTNYNDPFGLARDLLTWDPFREHGVARREFFGNGDKVGFAAPFEVRETDETLVLTGDLPGVKQDDVELSLDGNVLTVSGKRSAEKENAGDTYYVYERSYGRFSRSFRLPEHADGDSVEADLSDGVLTITIAKKAEAKPKKIPLTKRIKAKLGKGE